MTLNSFRQAISPDTPHTEEWYQGRGVYGGLIFAQLAYAVKQHTKLPLRRISVDMCAPVIASDISIQVTTARKGVNSHFFYVSAQQNQKIVAHGTIVCGGPRCPDFDRHQFSPPGNTPPIFPPITSNAMPAFSCFFDYWLTTGAIPFSKSENLRTGGWIRAKGDSLIDDEKILALLDAWWPALVVGMKSPRPMGTISFTADLSLTEPFEQEDPCMIESNSLEVKEGYSIETNLLWSAEGVLLAKAQQNVVIIR